MPQPRGAPFHPKTVPHSFDTVFQLALMMPSYVSSSISTVVMVSSTSPRIIFKCWSYA